MRGFTLVEMIIVVAILGVISAILAVFIGKPVEGYFAAVRRAELVDTADTALRRMGRDLRRAVPNSVRVTGTCGAGADCYLEFLPTTSGGRYRAASQQGTLGNLCPIGGTSPHDDFPDTLFFAPEVDTCFEILGPKLTFTAGDQIVVGNWGNPGSDAYEGNTEATHVRRAHDDADLGERSRVRLTSTKPLPLESPSKRFQVVAGAELAVTYACEGVGTDAGNGTGTLRRYWGYGIGTPRPPFDMNKSALIAENLSTCNIVYDSHAAFTRNGLVQIVVAITRNDETIHLYHEIHVDNLP